jgi:hypothetical protein
MSAKYLRKLKEQRNFNKPARRENEPRDIAKPYDRRYRWLKRDSGIPTVGSTISTNNDLNTSHRQLLASARMTMDITEANCKHESREAPHLVRDGIQVKRDAQRISRVRTSGERDKPLKYFMPAVPLQARNAHGQLTR